MACALMLCACGGSSSKSSESDEQHENESREMAVSTLKLKGTHASLFKVEEPYLLRLAKTPDEGWQVLVKINFIKAKEVDTNAYQTSLQCCHEMAYLDDSDVELMKDQYPYEDFSTLLVKEVGESEEIILKPFSFEEMSYEQAKKIYDAVSTVAIYDMELEEVEKDEDVSSDPSLKSTLKDAVDDAMDDDDMQDLKEAAETAGKILEAEKDLINALL